MQHESTEHTNGPIADSADATLLAGVETPKAEKSPVRLLSRDDMRAALVGATQKPPKYEDVPMRGDTGPVGSIRVKAITIGERDACEAECMVPDPDPKNKKGRIFDPRTFRSRILIRAVVDESFRPIFTKDDLPTVMALPAEIATPLLDTALRLGKITDEDVAELEGNSDRARADSSS